MRFDAVANRFCYLAGTKRALSIHGRGDQQRPFIHIKDASSVIRFCLAYREMTGGEIFNASSENTSILKLAENIQNLHPGVRIHYTEQDILTHLSFEISNEKLRKLGWEPEVNIKDGLTELLSNYTSFTKAITVTWDQEVFEV
jgi:nucleoside-diphosphate-sugar epimerase